ncbi:MAG: transporter substrate-binding domain-containing protein, partial [Clostridia bacterium]|nr:transporter substrate-binding domain-containing protein [Clostridia bacterium]
MKKLLTILLASVMLVGTCIGFSACGATLKGFDIDLAKAVFEDLGVEVVFEKINWDEKDIELSSKNIDLI